MARQQLVRRSVLIVILGLVGLVQAAIALAEEQAGLLDGKVFVGEIGKMGQDNGDEDTLIFQEGTFRSTACDPYGFLPGAYTAMAEGSGITFSAETNSPTDGTITWRGAVKGNALEGTFTWSPPGKSSEEYWVKGELQEEGS